MEVRQLSQGNTGRDGAGGEVRAGRPPWSATLTERSATLHLLPPVGAARPVPNSAGGYEVSGVQVRGPSFRWTELLMNVSCRCFRKPAGTSGGSDSGLVPPSATDPPVPSYASRESKHS